MPAPANTYQHRSAQRPDRSSADWFYVWIGGFCVLLTFGAFSPTFLIPVSMERFNAPPILYIHGVLFLAWPVFFTLQALWAASDRMERHRMLGLVGVALATAMVCVGLAALSDSLRDRISKGYEEQGRAITVVAFSVLLLFAGFVAAAVANVRRPEIHKRLMLLATISLMQAAAGRIIFSILIAHAAPFSRPGLFPPGPPYVATIPHLAAVTVLLAIALAYDWRARAGPHPATLAGGGVMLMVIALRSFIVETPFWHAITDGLIALGS